MYSCIYMHLYIDIHFENCGSNIQNSSEILLQYPVEYVSSSNHFDRLQGQYKSNIWRLRTGNRTEQLFKEHLKVTEWVYMVVYNNSNHVILSY